eukprot:5951083-Ditylum_brightwellii.AAC.1
MKQAENIVQGHEQYRTIMQDEFLPESTGSEYVAVHFFHNEYERCKIMDHHLKIIAPRHTTCNKLCIKMLLSLLVFCDGKMVDRLTGFEGRVIDPKDPDKWHTGRL